ncbi:MAG: hypothetical protein RLZ42_275, partial [Armatimonadota bacterium]
MHRILTVALLSSMITATQTTMSDGAQYKLT